MSLTALIARRRDALIDAFCRMPPLVSVENPAALGALTFLDEFEGGAGPGRLGRRRFGSVAVMRGAGGPDAGASLWVAAGYGDCRAAWRRFIAEVYGVSPSPADPVGFDVDHLLNRARSAPSGAFLRVEAVPSAINRSWGAIFEKDASSASIAKNQSGRRLMSYLIAAKLSALDPPTGADDAAGIDRIARHFAGRGLPKWETDAMADAIRGMLEHVERNR